jgi:hypothetical protein
VERGAASSQPNSEILSVGEALPVLTEAVLNTAPVLDRCFGRIYLLEQLAHSPM